MPKSICAKRSVPLHVPDPLVWDDEFGRFTMELDDPYEAGARLHDGPEILWSTHGYRGEQGAWMLVGFDAMRQAFMDHESFSSVDSAGTRDLLGVQWQQVPIEFDPPLHRSYRKFLNPLFAPKAVSERAAMVDDVCCDLIARIAQRETCEFITEFAQLMPSYVFLRIMGMPQEQVEEFLVWERETLWTEDLNIRLAGARKIRDYLVEMIKQRHRRPLPDMISAIARAEIDGRVIKADEAIGCCYSLFLGGLDTVMSVLGFAMRHLAENKALQKMLRADPKLIPKAVDEFLRAYGVVVMRRTVREDCVFRGLEMKSGDQIMLPTPLAGRDPKQFANPHLIDPLRTDKSGLTFGSGVHTCVGMHLARRELRVAFSAWLGRFKDVSIAETDQLRHRTGITWGVDSLPLTMVPA